MRLKKYIIEANKTGIEVFEKYVDKKMVKAMNDKGFFFVRGIKGSYSRFILKKTRPKRKPKDSSSTLHQYMDDWFKEKFGWRARSENVLFVTSNNAKSIKYYANNQTYIIFPLKPKKVIWSPYVADPFFDFNNLQMASRKEVYAELNDSDYREFTIMEFINKGKKLMSSAEVLEHEKMIQCKAYYGLLITYDVEFRELCEKMGLTSIVKELNI